MGTTPDWSVSLDDLSLIPSGASGDRPDDAELQLTRCLSLILHHPEVMGIAEMVRRLRAEGAVSQGGTGKDQGHE